MLYRQFAGVERLDPKDLAETKRARIPVTIGQEIRVAGCIHQTPERVRPFTEPDVLLRHTVDDTTDPLMVINNESWWSA